MTDEQKIIDVVDVSGCEHLYREIDCLAHIDFSECCEGYNHSYGYCPNIPNCYYKQLLRKEQECEELKKIINEAKNSKLDLKSFLVGEAVQNEYEQKLKQLKQTLAEIKEIAEWKNEYWSLGIDDYKNMADEILQKISESEER